MKYDKVIPFLVEKLTKYPDIKFDQKSNSELIIYPRNEAGFGITILTSEKENTLFLGDAYHSHFENSENEQAELLNQITFGLSGIARLKVWTKSDKAYKWTLELKDQNANWLDNGTTGLINLNFWTKPKFHYLQNDLLPI